jgi:hypothetical protein
MFHIYVLYTDGNIADYVTPQQDGVHYLARIFEKSKDVSKYSIMQDGGFINFRNFGWDVKKLAINSLWELW